MLIADFGDIRFCDCPVGAMVVPHNFTVPAIKMSRLTINLDDKIHQALKETAARQNRSIGPIIEESLKLRGIRSYESAKDLVAKARANSQLSASEAMTLAVDETRRY